MELCILSMSEEFVLQEKLGSFTHESQWKYKDLLDQNISIENILVFKSREFKVNALKPAVLLRLR